MDIPAFSIFSALSEVVVTVIVLYAILGNMRGGALRWKLLGAVLAFELCVNVVYMAIRAAHADSDSSIAGAMKLFLAAHGILSLLMFAGLIVLYLLAVVDEKMGRPTWFRRHAAMSWTFLVFWMVSVLSGEAIFVWRYLL